MRHKKSCFVIMPFGTEGSETWLRNRKIYEIMIKPVVENCGYDCLRADEIEHTGSITKDIIRLLNNSEIVIADLSDKNVNVFYELGIRHALYRRGTILIVRKGESLPFDIADYRVVFYSYELDGPDKFKKSLERRIRSFSDAIKNLADNPVHDVLSDTLEIINKEKWEYVRKYAETQFSMPIDNINELNSLIERLIKENSLHENQHRNLINKILKIESEFDRISDLIIHRLNNKIGGIKADINELVESQEISDSRVALALSEIINDVDATLKIPIALKDFRKDGKFLLSETNIYELIEECSRFWKNFSSVIEYQNLKDIPSVLGNRALLKEVFIELVTNAIKSIGNDGKIQIKAQKMSDDLLEISVVDDGKGIAKKDLPHIFDYGFTSWPNAIGLGEGLSMAKKIIEVDHKGSIRVESGEGNGATFKVVLPIFHAAHISSKKNIPARGKVLVVEDDSGWARRLREILSENGFKVTVARNKEAALSFLENDFFHFATIDLQLDENTLDDDYFEGFEILEKRKSEGMDTYMPSMVLTGFPHGTKERSLKQYKSPYFMEKSRFDRKLFIDTVINAVELLGVKFKDEEK